VDISTGHLDSEGDKKSSLKVRESSYKRPWWARWKLGAERELSLLQGVFKRSNWPVGGEKPEQSCPPIIREWGRVWARVWVICTYLQLEGRLRERREGMFNLKYNTSSHMCPRVLIFSMSWPASILQSTCREQTHQSAA
jgi:hypothetical protein